MTRNRQKRQNSSEFRLEPISYVPAVPREIVPAYFEKKKALPMVIWEISATRLWKQNAREAIEKRIDQYSKEICSGGETLEDHANHEHKPLPQTNAPTSQLSFGPVAQRVFDTSELLTIILSFSDPEVQLCAWNMSEYWRDAVKPAIIRSVFASSKTPPISFGEFKTEEDVSSKLTNKCHYRAIEQEVIFAITNACKMDRPESFSYWPARITQAWDFPAELYAEIQSLYKFQNSLDKLPPSSRFQSASQKTQWKAEQGMEPDTVLPVIPRWIDFSQLQVNPYFAWLFSGRITCTVSGYEISLLPAAFSSNQMIVPSAFSAQIIDLIKSQFLTHPPCKRLAIKYWDLKERGCIPKKAVPIRIIENKSGIKVLEMLATMQACVDEVTRIWLDQARQLRDAVSRVDYRQDIWHVSGATKLIIGFDFPFNHPGGLWVDLLMTQAYYSVLDNHQASHNTYSSLENRLAEWVPIELWPGYKSL